MINLKSILKLFSIVFLILITIILLQTIYNLEIDVKNKNNHNNDTQTLYNDNTWKNPVLYFVTNDRKNINDEFYMNMYIYDQFNSEGVLVDRISNEYKVRMRYRGSSSLRYPKKQYRLTVLEDDSEKTMKASLLGMPADTKWVLNAPYLDTSYARNYVLFGISRELFEWAPNVKLCEIYIDGEYQGVHLLIESVESSEGRLNLYDFALLNGQTSFIIKRDRVDDLSKVIKTYGSKNHFTNNNLILVEPPIDEITKHHKNWIEDYISDFESALYSDYYQNDFLGYQQFIDIDNFVDYYVLNLFSNNVDAGDLSTYIYRDLDSKLKLVPWDFNNALGLYANNSPYYIDDEMYNWFNRLLQDPYFRNKVVKRYYELRKNVLSHQAIENTISEYQNSYETAFIRDAKKWHFNGESLEIDNLTEEYLKYNYLNITQLKEFMYERSKYLDKNIKELLENKFSNE